jgi:maltokinase
VIDADTLRGALAGYLPRQRWFGGDEADAAAVEVVSVDAMRHEWPGLVQAMVRVPSHGSVSLYQVLLGLRPSGTREPFLDGRPEAVLGELDSELGPAVLYDAPLDPELALSLLARAAPDEHAERARPLGSEQSNTSVVFDERLVMKLFRRVAEGPNPDVEVSRALAGVGFLGVPRPVGEWSTAGGHVAVVSEFLAGGTDGFQLALTSLRDLYDARGAPEEAGGDFGPDAARLGLVTGEMHVALAAAFGVSAADPDAWLRDMAAQVSRTSHPGFDVAAVEAVEARLRSVDVGPAIRVHGDFHLGQVMRTDAGWYVLDFEGEPARPVEERRRPSAALRDVAGMLRSFHYAAEVGLREYGGDADGEVHGLAQAWERHNRSSFLEGYLAVPGIDAVLPSTTRARDEVLRAFEVDKAVYEVGYEASHRPEWVGIPLFAIERILEEVARA